jgi:hypothetical protein
MQAAIERFPKDPRGRKRKRTQQRARRKEQKLANAIGEDAIAAGVTAAARKYRMYPSHVKYYKKKLLQPGFHAGPWGGFRYVFRFSICYIN